MPLVAHADLPVFETLRARGVELVSPDNMPPLPVIRIGLLNLMPDTVLEVTERQFMQSVSSFDEALVIVTPFTVAAETRSELARRHIERHYASFESLMDDGLDGLIVTGANPEASDITGESFWQPMIDVIHQCIAANCSVICSCLATHAVMKAFYETDRIRLDEKRWGIYSHEVVDSQHPLAYDLDEDCFGPHSHVFENTKAQMEAAGIKVVICGTEAGVYLATSADDHQFVFLQGHPEYDELSLLKEFKREVIRFCEGDRNDFPPPPLDYFDDVAIAELMQYRQQLDAARANGAAAPEFPELNLLSELQNTWFANGRQIFCNWLRSILLRRES